MGFTTLSLKGRALRLLSQREHSRSELAAKLAPHAVSPEELAALLDLLVEQDWLSDQRAAQSLVHRRGPRLGAARLVRELRNRGVADELVREATAPLLTTEVQRAREVWQRKFGQVPLDMKERSRQVRFLMARGFTMHAIQKAIGGDTDGDTNDEDPGGAT